MTDEERVKEEQDRLERNKVFMEAVLKNLEAIKGSNPLGLYSLLLHPEQAECLLDALQERGKIKENLNI